MRDEALPSTLPSPLPAPSTAPEKSRKACPPSDGNPNQRGGGGGGPRIIKEEARDFREITITVFREIIS